VYSVSNPIKLHVNCFRSPLFYSFIYNYGGTSIVCLDGVRALWMPHFNEGGTKRYIISCTASVADVRTFLMMLLTMCIAPLYGGGIIFGDGGLDGSFGLELSKKSPLTRLQASVSDNMRNRCAHGDTCHFCSSVWWRLDLWRHT
jgi:hypothetical protein